MDESNNTTTLTQPPFETDEKVYCQDSTSSSSSSSGQWYEAVIRKARFVDARWSFLVHFAGWNNRWDRWLEANSILKDTVEHRTMVQQQQQENPAAPDASSGQKRSRSSDNSGCGPKQAAAANSSRKRLAVRNGDAAASTDGFVYADYCELPFTLKTVLVEEYERIAAPAASAAAAASTGCEDKPRRLVHQLPAPVSVHKVLNHFLKKKLKECHKAAEAESTSPVTVELVHDFCQGLTQLFQDALPVCLLYPHERPQYAALANQKNGKELVDTYGCEYLLRLYVRLPILLQARTGATTAGTNEWSPTVIGPLLTELLVLMQKNRQALFPLTVGVENANYRAPVPAEWMDWERRLYGDSSSDVEPPPPPPSPAEMDTR